MGSNENWLPRVLERIREARPDHAVKLLKLLPFDDVAYQSEAGLFFSKWFSREDAWEPAQSVEAYLNLLDEMNRLQEDYARTGTYPHHSFREVEAGFYSQTARMRAHLEALALAQFLWIDQWERFTFFSDWMAAGTGDSHLEVGPGHGLYLLRTLRDFNQETSEITALDVSLSSLESARAIAGNTVRYISADFLEWDPDRKFDSLTMGEVLEHVEAPARFLGKARSCLKDSGQMFVSTPIHAPMPDHITPFADTSTVRNLLTGCGFRIRREHLCAVDKLPLELAQRFMKPIMYCAILEPS